MQQLISHTQNHNRRYFNSDDTEEFGFIGAAIGAGVSLLPFIRSLFTACNGSQACGLAGINAFGEQVIQTLNQILQMLQAGILSPQQAISEAQKVAATLADSNYVYQAKNGQDAAALKKFKTDAAALVQQTIALAATATQGGVNPATGQITSNASGGSLSTTAMLMLAGVGLLGLSLIKR